MKLSMLEYVGISNGLGALSTAKRLRRVQEGVLQVPKSLVDQEQEAEVTRVNKYFSQLPTETIDGTIK